MTWNRRRRRANHKLWSQKKVMGVSMRENGMNKPERRKERENCKERRGGDLGLNRNLSLAQ